MNDKLKIEFKVIEYGSQAYSEELELRDRVLRKPLGMSLFAENLEAESNDIHLGAYVNDCLSGVLLLTKLSDTEVKMRQVAVDDGKRSSGIGSQLVAFSEQYCKQANYKRIVLNARVTAINFYERLQYTRISDEFLEIGIPHYKLHKLLL